MEDRKRLKNIIEALLIASGDGISREELGKVLGDTEMKEVDEALSLLREEYENSERAFSIKEIAGKCRVVTKPEYMPWINILYEQVPERLSGPSLETLAIIAYKQPATRAEIESVRGVNVGGVLKTLLEKELIFIKGRRNVVGKPLVYGTTDKFLEMFGLNSLQDLPALRDFSEEDLEYGKPREDDIIPLGSEEKEEVAALMADEEAVSGKECAKSTENDEGQETVGERTAGTDMEVKNSEGQ